MYTVTLYHLKVRTFLSFLIRRKSYLSRQKSGLARQDSHFESLVSRESVKCIFSIGKNYKQLTCEKIDFKHLGYLEEVELFAVIINENMPLTDTAAVII